MPSCALPLLSLAAAEFRSTCPYLDEVSSRCRVGMLGFLKHSDAAILRLPCRSCQLPSCQQGQQYQTHHPAGDCCHSARTAKCGRVNSNGTRQPVKGTVAPLMRFRAAIQVSKASQITFGLLQGLLADLLSRASDISSKILQIAQTSKTVNDPDTLMPRRTGRAHCCTIVQSLSRLDTVSA
jgi:hypothetical protein